MEKTKKKEFVEIEYTGYANGEMFDSNIAENLKKINSKAKAEKTIVIIGERMVVPGLDDALENKEIGKDEEIALSPKDAFGERKRELVRIVPAQLFKEKNINPQPGMTFLLDNNLVRISSVSGGRVSVDFNNPLAGKNVKYSFKIVRKVDNLKEKAETVFKMMFRIIPEFEIKDNKVVVKGEKRLEMFVNAIRDKFKEYVGNELGFELKEDKKENTEENKEK